MTYFTRIWALKGAQFSPLKEAGDEECKCLQEYHPICLWWHSGRMIPAEGVLKVYKKQTNHKKLILKVIRSIVQHEAGRRKKEANKCCFADIETFRDFPGILHPTGSSEKLLVVIRWFLQPKSHHGPGTQRRCARSHDRRLSALFEKIWFLGNMRELDHQPLNYLKPHELQPGYS